MEHYKVPETTDENGTRVPAHADEHSADPSNYTYHYRGGVVIVASNVTIGTYEDYAADENSPVEKMDEVDLDEYPTPDADVDVDEDDEDEEE